MTPEIEAIKHIGDMVDGKLVCREDCPSVTHMNTPDTDGIAGALARGYCSKENSHKLVDIDLIKAMEIEVENLLSSHTTYWKERVRKGVEGMKKDFVPADLIWEGDEEQEVGEWKYVPKEGGMYCLNCERFVPEEGCICGVISFEALDTLLDNLK